MTDKLRTALDTPRTVELEDLPSDVTPGVRSRVAGDYDTLKRECNRLAAKIENLWPLVTRNAAGFFVLRECGNRIISQAREAQQIIDYCESTMPKGTKIRWLIVPHRIAIPSPS
jgi:hypothetical protein